MPTLGMVGLFRPRKGVETLLRALMLMSVEEIPFRLKLIGGFVNEAYHREVRSLVDRLGLSSRVEFTGFRRDVKDHLAVLDVFVMPSLYGEGVPMALLEAMAVGRVIVASQVDGISEILTEGACGILVSPGDAVALAKAIGKAIRDPLGGARLSAAARTHQQSMYSVDTMVHRIFQVYRQSLLPQVGVW